MLLSVRMLSIYKVLFSNPSCLGYPLWRWLLCANFGGHQNHLWDANGQALGPEGSMCVCVCTQSCLTLCDPMDYSLPGSSVYGTFQARILEWVAMSSSGGSSQPGDWTQVSHIAGGFFTFWATREAYLLAYLPQTLLMLLLELSTQATILTSLWPSFQPPHLLPVSSSLLYSQQHQTTYSSPSTLNYIAQGHYPLLVLFLLPNPFFFNNKTTTWLQLTIKNAKRIKRKLYSTQILIPRR